MARSKKKKSKKNKSSGRAIWKGSISFGLVNIPVGLYAAEAASSLDFDLLDRRDFAPIKYQRVNKRTGREVPWNQIIKGYQYKKGDYVTLTDAEFRNANVEATQSIDILGFVDGGEISPMYYDKPYYLGPLDNGRAYSLLREVLDKSSKVAIARVVIRTRQHLAAVIPHGSTLVLNLLRFDHELRDAGNLDIPKAGKQFKISAGELKMAERLVESMAGAWKPKQYHDEYREDLLKMIDKKVKSGRPKIVSPEGKVPARKSAGKVVDIMHLLRRSVDQAQKKEAAPRRRKAG